MKACRRCGQLFLLSEFYAHPRMKDGHLNICKECTCARVKVYRKRNLEKVRGYDRKRGRSDARLSKAREYARRVGNHKHKAEWIVRNPEKRKAHLIVGGALKSGKLIRQTCLVCGDEKTEAHHDDYSKPLEVKWLCRKHHAEIHRRYE